MVYRDRPKIRRICRPLFRSRGFTVVELIVVMVLVGIFVATFVPRIGFTEFRRNSARAELISMARYAQESALWRGINVRVRLVVEQTDTFPNEFEVRVESVEPPQDNCNVATGTVTRLRTLPGIDTMTYGATLTDAAGASMTPAITDYKMVLQFDTLGSLESASTNCPAKAELDFDEDGEVDVCVEPSGYAHSGACFI